MPLGSVSSGKTIKSIPGTEDEKVAEGVDFQSEWWYNEGAVRKGGTAMFVHHEISNSELVASQDNKLEIDGFTCTLLENSWASAFRKYVLPNMNDEIFAGLYSPRSSRPCAPVNIIMGFLIIACFLGRSIKDMANSVLTDLEVRYALDLMTGDPKVLASYTPSALLQNTKRFMRRVLGYMSRTNEDILNIFLEDLFAKMAKAAEIHGDLIRMDSMMVASHIKNVSRLELLYITNMLVLKELQAKGYVKKIPDNLLHYLEEGDRNRFLYHNKISKDGAPVRPLSIAGD